MLELVPISDENSCMACGHTRKASEAFLTESTCSDCMVNNKVYPNTSAYPIKSGKNVAVKTRKKSKKRAKRSKSSISGQQIFSWLGGAALILVIAIGFKTFQGEKFIQPTIETVSFNDS